MITAQQVQTKKCRSEENKFNVRAGIEPDAIGFMQQKTTHCSSTVTTTSNLQFDPFSVKTNGGSAKLRPGSDSACPIIMFMIGGPYLYGNKRQLHARCRLLTVNLVMRRHPNSIIDIP